MRVIIIGTLISLGINVVRIVVVFAGKVKYVVLGKDGRRDYGSNKSFVRRLGSVLPFQPYPKIYISPHPKACIDPFEFTSGYHYDGIACQDSSVICDNHRLGKELRKCGALGLNLVSGKPDIIPTFTSTPKKLNESKIEDLEKQVEEMKELLHLLLEKNNMTLGSSYKSFSTPAAKTSMLPPPPPPPPPPLPPPPVTFSENVFKKQKVLSSHHVGGTLKDEKLPHLVLAEIAKSIKTVKLRPIERSPGGTPVRPPPLCDDPETILHAVLKRRNAAMLNVTPEAVNNDSTVNGGLDDSFSSMEFS